MQKTLKVGSRITLQDQLQLMMQIELLNVVFMMNTISIKGHLELIEPPRKSWRLNSLRKR